MAVSVEGLRAWEYDAYPAWDYERTVHLQGVWREAQRRNPLPAEEPGKVQPPEIAPGTGPQMVKVEP